ncbi:MAG: hypothetical protein KAI18_03070, partial [Candidatus Aenigmarchaeota archaeon]|nr:hypothetical protein [Candidatus Aenigmarchaeota archaeon]
TISVPTFNETVLVNETVNETLDETSNETLDDGLNGLLNETLDETLNETSNENLTEGSNETNQELNISVNDSTEIINDTIGGTIPQTQSQVMVIDLIYPQIVKIAQEFDINAVITSLYSKSKITAILSIPTSFSTDDNLSRQVSIEINNTQTIAWTINPTSCGNYSYSITATTNGTVDSRQGNIMVECDINPSISIKASIIENEDSKTLEVVGRIFDVNTDENIPANVTAEVSEETGDILFISTRYTEGPFKFEFTMPKEAQGFYNIEVFASTEQGLAFNSSTVYVNKVVSQGVINVDTEKNVYMSNETVEIIVGVVSSNGVRILNSAVAVAVTTPVGSVSNYYTLDGSLDDNGDGTYVIMYVPDSPGNYTIVASAISIDDNLDVENETIFGVVPIDSSIGDIDEILNVTNGTNIINVTNVTNIMNITNVTNTMNVTNVTNETALLVEEIEIVQGVAEVGEPVKWHKIIRVKNTADVDVKQGVIDADIPILSENIIVREKSEKTNVKSFSTSSISSLKVKATTRIFKEPVIKSKAVKEYVVEYETPAPVMDLKKVPENELPQNTNFYETIRIHHDDAGGALHYTNVTVRMPYSEKYDKLMKNGFIDLMWLGGTEAFFDEPTSIMNDARFNVTFEDSDGNGVDDTIVFMVPKLSGSDYGLAGYSCQVYNDVVGYTANKETKNYVWTPDNNCLATGLDCQMVNVSANRRYLDIGNAQGGYFRIQNPNTTWYYVSYAQDVDSAGCTPPYDAGSESIPWDYVCDEACGGTPGDGVVSTCNVSKEGFNASSYNVTLYGGNAVVTDILQIQYEWCWMEASPQLASPQIKSESSASWGVTTIGGWGEKFYFNISVVDPQGDDVNLTLWWNESYGASRDHSYLNETLCTACSPENNQTIDYQGFFCNTTESDLDTDVYFRINASDNSTGNYNNSWGPDSSYSFAIEEDDVNVFNVTP